jgi:hypothetical protein
MNRLFESWQIGLLGVACVLFLYLLYSTWDYECRVKPQIEKRNDEQLKKRLEEMRREFHESHQKYQKLKDSIIKQYE